MTATREQGDVIDLIQDQHEQIKELFRRTEQAPAGGREDLFCELRRLLAVHETAEEEIIYPVLRTAGDDGGRIADARIGEESHAKELLAALEDIDCRSGDFRDKLHLLNDAVVTHAEREEREVFRMLRQHQPPERLQAMRKVFELAESAAPTHPHPHGPASATGHLLIGPAAAIADRVRDAIHTNTSR